MKRLLAETSRNAELARQWADDLMKKDSRWQYLEIREARSLGKEIPNKGKVVILGLLKVGDVRLLDNLELELK